MSIHPDIMKAIEIIDQRIESLKQIRANLAKEFGMEGAVSPAPETRQLSLIPGSPARTSKDKIAEYLEQHAPASRSEIAEATGLPMGTISFALNDKKRFCRSEYGWANVSKEKQVLALPAPSGGGDTTEDSTNKTNTVRQIFREHEPRGLTPAELKKCLSTAGIALNVYGVIARLKKRSEIRVRGKRYHATEKLSPTPMPLESAVQ